MFKGMLHSINGHSRKMKRSQTMEEKSTNPELNGIEYPKLDTNSLKDTDSAGQASETLSQRQQLSAKQNIGKRSRKKLSAMLGKIHSSINLHTKAGKNQQHSGDQNNNNNNHGDNTNIGSANQSDDDDEDEQFYDLDLYEEQDNNNVTSETTTTLANKNGLKDDFLPEEQCDIPTFLHTKNCDQHLIEETRHLLKERYAKNPDSFYDNDYNRMLTDDWTVSRFLLRRRLDPKRTAKLMEECGRFRKQYKMSEVKLWEFPIEFHKAGGLFKYAPDRVGNTTVYMRVRMYRRVPEISDVFKAFLLCVLEESDLANNGRGTTVVFDLSGCGLQNVDLGFLSWLLSSFRNYCPKGVSYIIVYNLPWFLNATCKLAMTWMSASNRRALRFTYGAEIENFIARENLPDYMNGTCKINYRTVPEGSKLALDVCDQLDLTRQQAIKIRELFKEYLDDSDYATSDSKDESKNQKQHKQKQTQNQLTNGTTGGDAGDLAANTTTTNNNTIINNNTTNNSAELVIQASKFIA